MFQLNYAPLNPSESKAYRELLAKTPSILKKIILGKIDEIDIHSNNPHHNIYDTYLVQCGKENIVRSNISTHRRSVSKQHFMNIMDQWTHSDLCKFIIREKFYEPEERKFKPKSNYQFNLPIFRNFKTGSNITEGKEYNNSSLDFSLTTPMSTFLLASLLNTKITSPNFKSMSIVDLKNRLRKIDIPAVHHSLHESPLTPPSPPSLPHFPATPPSLPCFPAIPHFSCSTSPPLIEPCISPLSPPTVRYYSRTSPLSPPSARCLKTNLPPSPHLKSTSPPPSPPTARCLKQMDDPPCNDKSISTPISEDISTLMESMCVKIDNILEEQSEIDLEADEVQSKSIIAEKIVTQADEDVTVEFDSKICMESKVEPAEIVIVTETIPNPQIEKLQVKEDYILPYVDVSTLSDPGEDDKHIVFVSNYVNIQPNKEISKPPTEISKPPTSTDQSSCIVM